MSLDAVNVVVQLNFVHYLVSKSVMASKSNLFKLISNLLTSYSSLQIHTFSKFANYKKGIVIQ